MMLTEPTRTIFEAVVVVRVLAWTSQDSISPALAGRGFPTFSRSFSKGTRALPLRGKAKISNTRFPWDSMKHSEGFKPGSPMPGGRLARPARGRGRAAKRVSASVLYVMEQVA